ncbi:MAG TPA: 4a-hydroxytetrahydrobiopterin dehydratase [Gemmatimonadales bacterium]|jgi:4a-hydroxytetrahydrobiopterin dehydratase
MPNPKKLTETEITAGMAKLSGWSRKGDAIVKAFKFKAFQDGIRFVDRVALAADRADHHPDIDIRYTTVTMSLSTHSAGGLTANDMTMAAEIDTLV